MNICYIFVNYNNTEFSIKLVESIVNGKFDRGDKIIIVDNNSIFIERNKLSCLLKLCQDIEVLYQSINVGYFPAINIGIRHARSLESSYDMFVIGNNDLIFEPNFKHKLLENQQEIMLHPVISPDIVTLDGIHQNPHLRTKQGPLKELAYDVYYSNYFLSRACSILNKLKMNIAGCAYVQDTEPGFIEQGYGACYILTRRFFENFSELSSPSFLMHEEAFLTHQLDKIGFRVYYLPNIQVTHCHHGSTGKEKCIALWNFGRRSRIELKALMRCEN